MADCGTAVAVVLILVLSALFPYQNRPVVRLLIWSATAAAYSAAFIRGSPSLPWALLAMTSSMLLYNDFSGSLKSPKYVWPLVSTAPVTTSSTSTPKGANSSLKVSAASSRDLLDAEYVPLDFVLVLEWGIVKFRTRTHKGNINVARDRGDVHSHPLCFYKQRGKRLGEGEWTVEVDLE